MGLNSYEKINWKRNIGCIYPYLFMFGAGETTGLTAESFVDPGSGQLTKPRYWSGNRKIKTVGAAKTFPAAKTVSGVAAPSGRRGADLRRVAFRQRRTGLPGAEFSPTL